MGKFSLFKIFSSYSLCTVLDDMFFMIKIIHVWDTFKKGKAYRQVETRKH